METIIIKGTKKASTNDRAEIIITIESTRGIVEADISTEEASGEASIVKEKREATGAGTTAKGRTEEILIEIEKREEASTATITIVIAILTVIALEVGTLEIEKSTETIEITDRMRMAPKVPKTRPPRTRN